MKPRSGKTIDEEKTDEEKIDAYLLEVSDWLALIEAGPEKLTHYDNVMSMSKIIKNMSLIEDKVSEEKKNIWLKCLAKAYRRRGQSYLYKSMHEEALADFEMLQKLMPKKDQEVINLIATEATENLKADITLKIDQCEMKLHRKKVFSGQPNQDARTPKAQRAQPTEPQEKPKGKYVKIGQANSAFYKHEQRPRSPSPRSSQSHHLNQPGGRTGRGK